MRLKCFLKSLKGSESDQNILLRIRTVCRLVPTSTEWCSLCSMGKGRNRSDESQVGYSGCFARIISFRPMLAPEPGVCGNSKLGKDVPAEAAIAQPRAAQSDFAVFCWCACRSGRYRSWNYGGLLWDGTDRRIPESVQPCRTTNSTWQPPISKTLQL
jgi:hypothetical protein